MKLLQSNKKIMREIKELTSEIASGKTKSNKIPDKFCDICTKIRKERIICKLHESNYPPISPCESCFK